MRGNLHKSDAGWVRLQARVNAMPGRQVVRTAQNTEYTAPRPMPKAKPEAKPEDESESGYFIVRNGRKQRRAFVAHNGRR